MSSSLGQFINHAAKVLFTVDRAVKRNLNDMLDDAVVYARQPPPKGSPVAGVFDSRLPNPITGDALIGRRGGANRASIEWSSSGLSYVIQTRTGYGGYLELGTKKMVARPYIAPGIRSAGLKMKRKRGRAWE